MKYIFTRISILILAIILIYYISDYGGYYAKSAYDEIDGGILFFKLLFWLLIISLGVFFFEAYKFNKKGRAKERNRSLWLIFSVVLLVIIYLGYFLGLI